MNDVIIDYYGKKVFIGIDVHRRQYTVSCRYEGMEVKRCTMPAEPEALLSFISKFFRGAEVHTAYEAGFSGFVLHRILEGNGIRSIVVHAASIEVSKKKVKTDKRDSRRIAEQLEVGRLRGVRVPSVEEELRRVVSRTRAQLVKAHTRILNQIRMKFYQFGLLPLDDKRAMGQRLAREVLGRTSARELHIGVESLLAVRKAIHTQIRAVESILDTEARQDPVIKLYRKMFGPLAAQVFAHELGDLSQFPNEKCLFSFVGLTPSETTSDETRRLGHITREGASRLRHMLVESAWRTIKTDEGLRTAFERIAARAGKKRAIVAIARKLIGRARALFRQSKEDSALKDAA
jgi:transposase